MLRPGCNFCVFLLGFACILNYLRYLAADITTVLLQLPITLVANNIVFRCFAQTIQTILRSKTLGEMMNMFIYGLTGRLFGASSLEN